MADRKPPVPPPGPPRPPLRLVKGGAAPESPKARAKAGANDPYDPQSKFSRREQQIQFAQALIQNACPRQELLRAIMNRYACSNSKAASIIRFAYEDIKANTPNPEERRINIEQMLLNNYRRAHLVNDIRAANQAAMMYAQVTGNAGLAENFKRVLDGLANAVTDPQVISGVQRLYEQLTARAAKGNLAALEQAEQLSDALIRCGISVERAVSNNGRRGVLVLPAEQMHDTAIPVDKETGETEEIEETGEPPRGGDAL